MINSTTGIVRRIDDLGRIVIPKEIRRLFKIREGDPLEIFVTDDGIVFKKFSPMVQLTDFAKEYASSLHESTDHIVIITDIDKIIAVAGGSRREYLDKYVGSTVVNYMGNQQSKLSNDGSSVEIVDNLNEDYESYVIVPIILNGESIGSVIMLNRDKDITMGMMELKMAKTSALFLSKQMDNE